MTEDDLVSRLPLQLQTWILSATSRALCPADFVSGLAEHCERGGLPLLRVSTSLQTLHPEVFALNLQWSRAEGTRARAVAHAIRDTPQYEGSPAQQIIEGGESFAVSLSSPGGPPSHPLYAEVAVAGATEYFIQPLIFQDGRRSFISWTTDRPGGFGEALLAELKALLPLLTLRLELAAAHHSKASLLEVYLGRNAANRVLSGAVQRGTGTSIHAALWYCDMRGFTRLGDRLGSEALVALLDQYFEALAEPIARHGGEILKFIGDAVLAIFPVEAGDATSACAAALEAAEAALAAVAFLEAPCSSEQVKIGIGLHLGHVMYGNIGARARLDFTVIGSSVNEVARVEALCKEAGAPLLLTEPFRAQLGREDLRHVGRFHLAGVRAPQDVYTLRHISPKRS